MTVLHNRAHLQSWRCRSLSATTIRTPSSRAPLAQPYSTRQAHARGTENALDQIQRSSVLHSKRFDAPRHAPPEGFDSNGADHTDTSDLPCPGRSPRSCTCPELTRSKPSAFQQPESRQTQAYFRCK
ncbi:uncharacterized protein SCHCODRAFT_01240410 [Schizophyllum commune H4-8]|uniref:uncharacterized protein n=1 Tax=Schizophyllum commune (strain H4-8 / FGSC 9210) TaxID=578458 RepID=UPI0021606A86|nr:uncharacterized protein SCHCODRAFT_01240410 [Schizophyllum commune H4-8]KAI5887741.1 hypothetical protein SCHCODRAFT_01240410 [Schizophyllum commune H4-8]